MREKDFRRICRRAFALAAGAFMASALAGGCAVARVRMAVHVLVKVDYSEGKPAPGIPLWYVDRALQPSERSVDLKDPICRTDARGECTTMVVYHHCETVFPWRRQARMSYRDRFEIVTLLGGHHQSLGFLQGVKSRDSYLESRDSYLEGTLWARLD